MFGYDLGQATPALRGFSLALYASNLFDKTYVSACPFSNSCYFAAGRPVVGSLRFQW